MTGLVTKSFRARRRHLHPVVGVGLGERGLLLVRRRVKHNLLCCDGLFLAKVPASPRLLDRRRCRCFWCHLQRQHLLLTHIAIENEGR